MARFEEIVNIQSQQTSTGAAQGLMSLAQRLEQFQSSQSQITAAATSFAEQSAVRRGSESAGQVVLEKDDSGVTKRPALKEKRFIGGIEVEAHNKALRAAYLSSLNNDAREGISRIRAENDDDLISFNEAVGSFAKGMIDGVDPSVRQDAVIALNSYITSARSSVQAANIKKDNDIAFQELQESAKKAQDAAIVAARVGDIESSARELMAFNGILQEQVNSGFVTEPQARELSRTAELNATQSRLIGIVRSMTDEGDFMGALNTVAKARKNLPKGMSTTEHQNLVDGMLGDVSQAISIQNKLESLEDDTSKKSQNIKFNELYIGIVGDGTTTVQDITMNLNAREITQPQASKLITALNSRGFGVDDWSLVRNIQESIRNDENPEEIRDTIISNSGSRLTEQTATGLITTLNNSIDDEAPLKQSRVQRARDFIVPSIRVTGILGSLDSEAEKRLAKTLRKFDERVLEGEDPFMVADELVGKDTFERAQRPKFGTKDDLEKSLELLEEAAINKTIDQDTYNDQVALIKRLMDLKNNIEAFDKAKKEQE